MVAPDGAALPWGAAAQPEPATGVQTDLPLQLGLQPGHARLEVLWELETEGAEEPTIRKVWWGALLVRRLEGEDGAEDGLGRRVYELEYDANSDLGFAAAERRRVTFDEEHVLYDVEEDDELFWRKAGTSWEPPAEEAGLGEEERVVYSLQEIDAAIKEREQRRGVTVDQECEQLLSALPQERQRAVAEHFRSFSEHITAALGQVTQGRPDGYVVTERDMKEATARALAALRGL